MDWPFSDPEIVQAAKDAAAGAARRSGWMVEREDMEQEAFLYMLTHREEIERQLSPDSVRWVLYHRLLRKAMREEELFDKEIGFEEYAGEWERDAR